MADFFNDMISFTNSAILKSGKYLIATKLYCRRGKRVRGKENLKQVAGKDVELASTETGHL